MAARGHWRQAERERRSGRSRTAPERRGRVAASPRARLGLARPGRPQRAQQRVRALVLEAVAPALAPALRLGAALAVEGVGQGPDMLGGMVEIDDLNRPAEVLGREMPDPGRSIT